MLWAHKALVTSTRARSPMWTQRFAILTAALALQLMISEPTANGTPPWSD
jgi:hypothetical protein